MSQQQFEIYGLKDASLEDLVTHLQDTLDIQLEERESGYYAGIYYLYKISYGKELRLYKNFDEVRDCWVRDRYREYSLIVEVSNMDNMDAIRSAIVSIGEKSVLLSSKILDSEE